MSSVPIVIHRIIGICGKVPAVDIIDISVSVIIDAVSWNFLCVGPDILGKIRMVVISTGIDDCNNNRVRTGCLGPCRDDIDIGTAGSTVLTGIIERPLLIEPWIIRPA